MQKYYTLVNKTGAPLAWETVLIGDGDYHGIWKTTNLAHAVLGRSILMGFQAHNRYKNLHVLLEELNFQQDINRTLEAEILVSLTRSGMCKKGLWFAGDYPKLNDLCFVCLSETVSDFIILDSRGHLIGSTYSMVDTQDILRLVTNGPLCNIHISHNLTRKTLNIVDIRNFLPAH